MSEVSQALLDKYRDINTDHDWWEWTYAELTERVKLAGILADSFLFSGFWSQGDGACFNGEITTNADMHKYLAAYHNDDEFPMLRKVMQHGGEVWSRWRSEGMYCHENTLVFEVDSDQFYNLINADGNELRQSVIDAWDEVRMRELDELEESIKKNVKDICRKLYRQLEEEYEYLTSDEAVAEAIIANELDNDDEE